MVPHTRRDALKALPALAVSLPGCTSLADDEHAIPTPTTWQYRLDTATPAIKLPDGPLLVGSRSPFSEDPVVTALGPGTGEELWTVTGGKGRGSPLAYDDQFVYAFSEAEEAFAVDFRNGEVEWKTTVTPIDRADPGVVQFPPIPLTDTVALPISGTEDDVPDRIVGLDRSDGKQRFSHGLPASLAGEPARNGDAIVVPLLDGTIRSIGIDGTERWRVDVGAPLSGVTISDETAFVGSATEELLALDAASGEQRWSGTLENTLFTRPRVTGGRVLAGGADYYLYSFDLASGERQWRTEMANAVTFGPTLIDESAVTLVGGPSGHRGPSGSRPFSPTALYVHDAAGTVVNEYRFEGDVEGGEVKWAVATGDGVYLGQEWRVCRLAPEVLDDE